MPSEYEYMEVSLVDVGGKKKKENSQAKGSFDKETHTDSSETLESAVVRKNSSEKIPERGEKKPVQKSAAGSGVRSAHTQELSRKEIDRPKSSTIEKQKLPTDEAKPEKEVSENYLYVEEGPIKTGTKKETEKAEEEKKNKSQHDSENFEPVQQVEVGELIRVPKKKDIPPQPDEYLKIAKKMMKPIGEESVDNWVEKAGDENALEKIAPDDQQSAGESEPENVPMMDPVVKRDFIAKMRNAYDEDSESSKDTEKRKKIEKRNLFVFIGGFAALGLLVGLAVSLAVGLSILFRCTKGN